MELPSNEKISSQFSQRLYVSEIMACRKQGYLNAEKAPVRTLIDSQYVKV